MNTQRPHILLIEDSPADANLVEEAFSDASLDYLLSVVSDGEQAIGFFERLDTDESHPCPDLILLDLNLPRVNGNTVLERLRLSPRCKDTKVLIISSSDAPTDRQRAMELGASDYFRKPSSLAEFMELGPKVQAMLQGDGRRAAEQRG